MSEKYDYVLRPMEYSNRSTTSDNKMTSSAGFSTVQNENNIYDKLFTNKDRTKLKIKKSKSICEKNLITSTNSNNSSSKLSKPIDFKKLQASGSFRLRNIIEDRIIDKNSVRIDEFGNVFSISNNHTRQFLDSLNNSSHDSPRGSCSNASTSSTHSIEPAPQPLPQPPQIPLPLLPTHFQSQFSLDITNNNMIFSNANQYQYDYNLINNNLENNKVTNISHSNNSSDLSRRNSNHINQTFSIYTNFDEEQTDFVEAQQTNTNINRIIEEDLDAGNKNQSSNSNSKSSLSSTERDDCDELQQQEYESIRDIESDKKRFSKSRIIDELIQTEMDYFKVIKLVYDVYYNSQREYNFEDFKFESIFCNLKEIVDLSNKILHDFEENILNKPYDNVRVGVCFLRNSNLIRKAYAHYAQFIECSIYVLDKNNEKVHGLQEFIENGLKLIREQTTSAFNLHSLLLKPIQRVLKYPLLLQELLKNTDTFHCDYVDLKSALMSMQEVASYINEIKRRRDMIYKYGRKDREQKSISEKIAKLSFHSVVKKSNRIGMKISNAFKFSEISTVDKKFNILETKFRYFEKLIKIFNRDTIGYLHNLKEFFKAQTVIAESIQEYYGENQLDDLSKYVEINASSLNNIYNTNVNFVHENVLRPLNLLLKYLEIPNKLITKRHDKLLDYECARSNIEKLKDNKHLIKTLQAKLHESQRNFEALNNQLIEELPILISKCSEVFCKCFWLYLKGIEAIQNSIHAQLDNFVNQNTTFSITKSEKYQTINTLSNDNQIAKSYLNLKNNFFQDTKKYKHQSSIQKTASLMSKDSQKVSSFRKPLLKKLKQFTDISEWNNSNKSSQSQQQQQQQGTVLPQTLPPPPPPQSQAIETLDSSSSNISKLDKLKENYKSDNLFKVVKKFTGLGVSSDINLEPDDVVGVIKKSDPTGDSSNWFVDNGEKGLVSCAILRNYDEIIEESNTDNNIESKLTMSNLSSNNHQSILTPIEETVTRNGETFIQEVTLNDVKETDNKIILKKEIEYCIALYNFDAIDETTLTVSEGDKLRILQKHDDNFNTEWWLLEKCDERKYYLQRGYVPSNYVQILQDFVNSTSSSA